MSSIIAIDFGNKNCLVAAYKDGSINILNNQASQRSTPSMISFSEHRRYFGVFAQQKRMENTNSTITQLIQLVGLRYEAARREKIQLLEFCNLLPGVTGFTFVQFNFLEKETVFSIEQCVAFLLNGCFEIAKLNNIFTDQCVIIVPPWWSEIERKIIIDSAKVAGLKISKLLNSTTAQAITYYVDHKKKIDDQETKYAIFIDFGDCCLSSSVVQFHDKSIEVKSCCCDNNIGGSHFTLALVNYLIELTKKKYKEMFNTIDLSNKSRSMIRFIEAAEKLKKGLSVNQVMTFELDSLADGGSIEFTVQRSEFEKNIQNLVNCIVNPIEKSIKMANISKEDLFTIEVHGGASRMPVIKEKIKEIFDTCPVQFINSDEYIAMGAGYQAIILSPQFRFNIDIKDVSYYQITIECDDFPEKNHRKLLFEQFQPIPCVQVLTHNVKQNAMIKVISDNTVIIGIIYIKLQKQEEANVKITIQLNQDGIIEVPKAVLVPPEKSYWSIGLPSKANDFDENDIIFKYKSLFGLPDAVIDNLKNQEKEMEEIDKSEEERDNVRNSLESYIFKLKNALEYDYKCYFEPDMIDNYKKLVDEAENWFYKTEDERHSIKTYNEILNQLKAIGDPVFKLKKDRENLLTFLDLLIDRANKCKQAISNLDSDIASQLDFKLDQFVDSVHVYENEINSVPLHISVTNDEDKSLKMKRKDALNDQIYRIEKELKSLLESLSS